MSQYGKARMQSPGTAERLTPSQIARKRAGLSPDLPAPKPTMAETKPTPVEKAVDGVGRIQSGISRLKGNPDSQSHAYNWRQREGLKRGR